MIASLIQLVLYIVILGVVVGLLLWLLDLAAGVIPEPFHFVARILVIVVAVLIVVVLLLDLAGVPGVRLR